MEPIASPAAQQFEAATSEGSSYEANTRSAAVSAPAAPAREERRRKPRTWETPPAPVPAPHLDDYKNIVGQAEIDELRFLAEGLKGKSLKMVNSTAVGGGVAEMLNQMVPLLNEVELQTHWDVITGGNDFFEVTKAFHNALQGSEYKLTQQARDIFLMHNEQNLKRMQFTEDLIVIHDPQPAALIRARQDASRRWIWRCHIDLSSPNPDVWGFCVPSSNSTTRLFFLHNLSPGNYPFLNICSIPASIHYPRKIKISTTISFSRCATNLASTVRAQS